MIDGGCVWCVSMVPGLGSGGRELDRRVRGAVVIRCRRRAGSAERADDLAVARVDPGAAGRVERGSEGSGRAVAHGDLGAADHIEELVFLYFFGGVCVF